MDCIEFLKENINENMSLSDIVSVFEKMCEEPMEDDLLSDKYKRIDYRV